MEEGLDQQSVVAHVNAQSVQKSVQSSLLIVREARLGIKDGGGAEGGEGLRGVLLKCLIGKDIGDLFAEVDIVDEGRVSRVGDGVVVFQQLVLVGGEHNLLGMEGGAELGGLDASLA